MKDRPPIGSGWGVARRTSFARRERNLALVRGLAAGALLGVGLVLLLLARVAPETGARLRGATADLLSPLVQAVVAPVRALERVRDALDRHIRTVERLRAAEAELARLRQAAGAARIQRERLAELEALLHVRRAERRLVVTAEAAALAAHGGTRQAVLAAGWRDGVRPRMPAIAPQGLAGRVTDVGLVASRVLLLSDPNSRVPVRVERTGLPGIAAGTGGADLRFLYDPVADLDPPRVGDRLVTSGDGGLFPPGLPVGVVVDAGVHPPRVRPFVRPGALGVLAIEAPWLPPAPPLAVPPAPDEPDQAPPARAPGAAGAAGAPNPAGAAGAAGAPNPAGAAG